MSDILEDQKIHLIVKDYKRMYEQHEKLVEIGKEFQKQLIAKEKELEDVKAELADVKAELNGIKSKGMHDDKPKKALKIQLNEIKSRSIAINNRLTKDLETLGGLLNNLNEIEKLLKSDEM